MSRKDTLRSLLAGRAPELPAGNSGGPDVAAASAVAPVPLVRSGAVGAMSRSLGHMAEVAENTRALLASGNAVIEIDSHLIDASFLADRLAGDEADHDALVASMRTSGQQVPILVRHHPSQEGRFQIAYGHRRLRAATELRRPVRAIVRTLDDEQLVVAQGQENSARMDLSYIERALFAAALEEKGFGRDVIMAALSVEKTQLSKLIAVAKAVPGDIARAIGPAPKTGRPKWMELAERLQSKSARALAAKIIADTAFGQLGSDARFVRTLEALNSKAPNPTDILHVTDGDGNRIAKARQLEGRVRLDIDEKTAPKFGEFVIAHLPELYLDFCKGRVGTG